MQPDRLEVLARHRGQKGLIGHARCPTKFWISPRPQPQPLIALPGRPRPATRPRAHPALSRDGPRPWSADSPRRVAAHIIAEAREALPLELHAVAEDRPNLGAENPEPGLMCVGLHASS